MRKVTYFKAGVVADFIIPDELFEEFSKGIGLANAHSEDELTKARIALGAFVGEDEGKDKLAGPGETLAACYVWNYFNTHPEDEKFVEGDIVVIDLDGEGETIDYAAAADIQIAPLN